MNQLGAAAESAFSKVTLFQKQHAVPARSGIQSDTRARGAASDNDHFPGRGGGVETAVHFFAGHQCEAVLREIR